MTWNDWLGIAGFVTGIIGIFLAWYFYRRPFSGKSIGYMATCTMLISETQNVLPREVTVQYDGHNIRDLIKATCTIWNTGHTTISGTDIVSTEGLDLRPCNAGQSAPARGHETGCLEIGLDSSAHLLKASIDARSLQENQADIWPDPKSNSRLFCTFRFLDPHQGFKIGILYTGDSKPCSVKGVIKGIPGGITMANPSHKIEMIVLFAVIACIGALMPIAVIGLVDYVTSELGYWSPLTPYESRMWGALIAVGMLPIISYASSGRISLFVDFIMSPFMSKRLPEDLRD